MALYLAGVPDRKAFDPYDATQQLVYGVIFGAGIVVAAAVRALIRGGSDAARHSVTWLALIAVGLFAYNSRAELRDLYVTLQQQVYPSMAMSTTQGTGLQVRRSWDGHYRVDARINGHRQNMMIDTGASMVLIPYEDIGGLGIDPHSLDFSMPVVTANGRSTIAPVVLDSIRIGPIQVFDVPAAVAQPRRLKMGLLGMSFLDRLSETAFRGDRLYLRP